MPKDHVDVVMVEGADGNPVRVNKEDFEADQADDGAKQYRLHSDHEQYDHNGELIGAQNDNEPQPGQSIDNAAANMADNPDNQNTTTLTGADRTRADRIAATNFGVVQEKKRFFVVDMNKEGERITDMDGIDPKGYKSNKEAWDALFIVRTEAANVTPVAAVNAEADAEDNEDEETTEQT